MKQYFVLLTKPHPSRSLAAGAVMGAPDGYVCKIEPPTRSLEQNALLHAALSDISSQVAWAGKKFDLEIWKRLCVAAWLREQNEKPLLIPSLDNIGVDIIYEKTSKLTTTQCSSLVEWCFAFGAEHNVKFRE